MELNGRNDNGVSVGTILSCPLNSTVLATVTGTVYAAPGNVATPLSVATEGLLSFPIPRAGTLRNLYVRTSTTAKVNTPTTVVTVRVNGADTALTVTVNQNTSTTTSDTTHSVSVNAGDLVTVSLATSGLAGVSVSLAGLSFELG